MRGSSLLIVFVSVASYRYANPVWGQDRDRVRVRLDQARGKYETEMEKLRTTVEQHVAKLEKLAAAKGDAMLTSQIRAEYADFEKTLELPLSVQPTVRQRFTTARATLLRAYSTAMAEYERGKQTAEREMVEQELHTFREQTAGLDIDGTIAARVGPTIGATNKYQLNTIVAEQARKVNARLVVEIQDSPQEINIADTLPDEPFIVTEIHFPEGTKVNDGDLLPISALSALTRLSVRGSDVTDQGVKQLSVLPNLKFINLHATRVTDQSLFILAKMGTLEVVDVGYNSNITDTGIRALGALNGLRSVTIGSQKVSPGTLRWIQTRLKK